MTRIKHLRKILGYTQDKLAKKLGVSRSTVAMWETSSQAPDYETLLKLSDMFGIPQDFVMAQGIFSKWDDIIANYDAVSFEIIKHIPADLYMQTFCEEKCLRAWLDTRLYCNQAIDELQLARWFSFAIKDIKISTKAGGFQDVIVDVSFTPEFAAIIETSKLKGDGVKPYVHIPILGSVPAGIPLEAIENIIDWEEIPASMCNGDKEYFALQVKGDSMWPDILSGDTVIVRKTPCCESGDICVVYVNGDDATLKQVKFGEDGSLSLIPRNQSYPPRTYTHEEVLELPVAIAGVVEELRRKMGKG